ncbi:MAG: LPS-assembly protein LptD, partial [Chthoniobacterales bacterium]|nr:LPS-assembly protein LptD [Chthoniobacterales bacterium]
MLPGTGRGNIAGRPVALFTLQPHPHAITFGAAMRKPVLLVLCLLALPRAWAQELEGPGSLPIEINSTGQTTYENGLATARDNVAIHFGDTDIYSDFAQYDEAKRTIFLKGNVRIYRGISLYTGGEATYNLDSKAINATNMRSGTFPYLMSGRTVTSASDEEYTVKNGSFTTDDSEHPDFHLNAQSVRIYENDRVIFKNVTFYIGETPVFWWPYLYQSLDRAFSYSIAPAYLSSWGPSLLGQITFPIGEKITSTVKLDYRSRRGVALGFDSEIRYGKDDKSFARFSSYYLQDQNPDLNRTSLPRQGTPTSRFRLSLQNRTHLMEGLEAT